MPRERLVSRRALVWGVFLVALAATVTSWWLARRRLDGMKARLVERSHVLLGAPTVAARTVGDPQPGSVADKLEEIYPMLAAELLAWDAQEEQTVFMQCAYVRDGRWPLSGLPRPCRSMVEAIAIEFDTLVDASQSSVIGDASRWQDLQWWPLARAATAVALRARIALDEDDDPERAVWACLGLIELWRDISHVVALQTATASSTLVSRVTPVCADAIVRSDRPTRRRAAIRLATVLSEVAPISLAVRREALLGELAVFAPSFSEGFATALHPAASRRIRASGLVGLAEREPWWLAPFVLPPTWQAYDDVMETIAGLADQRASDVLPTIDTLLSDPELPDLARTAASARWANHLHIQQGARADVRRLQQIASGSSP